MIKQYKRMNYKIIMNDKTKIMIYKVYQKQAQKIKTFNKFDKLI